MAEVSRAESRSRRGMPDTATEHEPPIYRAHKMSDRAPGPEEVGRDQAAERRQAVEVAGDGGLVPQQVDQERGGGDEEEIGPRSPTIWYARCASPSRA